MIYIKAEYYLTLFYVLISQLVVPSGSVNEHRACYSRFANCDIACPDPYKRIWRVPDQKTCIDFCAADKIKCLGAVYKKPYQICDLYNVTSTAPNVVLLPAFGNVYYSLNNTSCIAGYTGTAPILTTTTYQPKTTTILTTIPTTIETTSTTQIITLSSGITETVGTTIGSATTVVTPSTGGANTCPSGSQPVYVALGGQNIQGKAPISTSQSVVDPSTCVATCSSNKDPSGKAINCQSFTFDAAASACNFFDVKPKPDGSAALVAADTSNIFMKTCVPASSATANCVDGLLPANSVNVLSNHVKKDISSGVDSMAKCVGRCLGETSFQCQSVNYIPSKQQCQLNDANSASASTDFTPAPSGALYVENTCIGRKRRKGKARLTVLKKSNEKSSLVDSESESEFESWSTWTSCLNDGDNSIRVRLRLCKGKGFACSGKKVDYEKCL